MTSSGKVALLVDFGSNRRKFRFGKMTHGVADQFMFHAGVKLQNPSPGNCAESEYPKGHKVMIRPLHYLLAYRKKTRYCQHKNLRGE